MPKSLLRIWGPIILVCLHITALVLFLYTSFTTPSFPPTLVINLDSRPDKWTQTYQELAGWPTPPQRISAVSYNPGWKGCALSHLKCLDIAKKRNYPWVLCLEDDCQLTPDALDRFTALLPYLWTHKHRWDIFSGGLTSVTDAKVINKETQLVQAKGYTTHFCLIHKKAYDWILRHAPKTTATITEPIDTWYAKHLRIWTTVPFLAVQRPVHSDIEQKQTDYTDMFAGSEAKLKQLLAK